MKADSQIDSNQFCDIQGGISASNRNVINKRNSGLKMTYSQWYNKLSVEFAICNSVRTFVDDVVEESVENKNNNNKK